MEYVLQKKKEILNTTHEDIPDDISHTIHLSHMPVSFDLKINKNPVRVIELVKHNILTNEIHMNVKIVNNIYQHDPHVDCLKLVSIERHHNLGSVGIGLVKGFGFQDGALGMSVAHDSHNIVIVGSNDHDISLCVKRIVEIQGGVVLVKNHQIIEEILLNVAGLMTTKPALEVASKLSNMKNELYHMGLNMEDDPLIALSFLCLPVIPKLKLTDQGLFDVESFQFVNIEV